MVYVVFSGRRAAPGEHIHKQQKPCPIDLREMDVRKRQMLQ